MSKYPSWFPVGCPPEDAVFKEIQVFRMCKKAKITHDDFLSKYELGKADKYKDDMETYINCFGVSVFDSLESLKRVMKFPAQKNVKKLFFAVGFTRIEMGKVKRTMGRNHITWWLYDDAKPETVFKII